MKLHSSITRGVPLTAHVFALFLAGQGWCAPTISSVTVTPIPLVVGQSFAITAIASSDATQGTATVDFRPWATSVVRVGLTKQGNNWTGTGVVPASLQPPPGVKAAVKVLLFDTARQRVEFTVQVSVIPFALSSAVFDPATGILTVTGDNQANTLAVSRSGAGTLLVNNGAIPITGGLPTVANTTLIRIFGLDGDDNLSLDESGGALPQAHLLGGPGNDTLTGGSGPDDLAGGPGEDTLLGRLGADNLDGGDDDDILTGGRDNDQLAGGTGADSFDWFPGDGSDVVEGQGGEDLLLFSASNAGEVLDLSANGGRLRLSRNVANIVMDVNGVELVQLDALGGADAITVGDLSGLGITVLRLDLANPPGSGTGDGQLDTVVINGSTGGDSIALTPTGNDLNVIGLGAAIVVAGSEGAADALRINALGGSDTISASGLPSGRINLTIDGGGEDDLITGSRGNDTLLGGEGGDRFVWNPGDGSDIIEGQDGLDTLLFNGSAAGEAVDLSANGSRLRFFRNIASVTMDVAGVEAVRFNALGGADTTNIDDLSGVGVTSVTVDLSSLSSPGTGDSQADSVVVRGTGAADAILVSGSAGNVLVNGLAAQVNVLASEPALDQLSVQGLAGADVMDATSLSAGVIKLTMVGGLEGDILLGSGGDDVLIGDRGDDTILAGAGADTFVWNPGDGSDVLEGQVGFDELIFNGSGASESINLAASGSRLRFTRDVASIVMDINDVESVQFNALGGPDTVTLGDLSGLDVTEVNIDLANPAGSGTGDGQADTIIANATAGDDVALVFGDASGVSVIGLAATLNITGSEAANDRLIINLLAGDDVLEASGLAAGALTLTANGGDNDDVLIGSDGADLLFGDAGDDVLLGGLGTDVLDGGTGDNIVIQ